MHDVTLTQSFLEHFHLLLAAGGEVAQAASEVTKAATANEMSLFEQFLDNFVHNLFKPLLLFFYLGFLVPLLKVPFEFPKVLYQGLTIYLLLAIGWHGGEELASLSAAEFGHALGFMVIGFITNFMIGFVAYVFLRNLTRLRKIDAATVAGFYGSDSAGTFVTCLGVITAAGIGYAAYMPVLLAVMEIPGCLVALFLVSRMRSHGQMDAEGNVPGEPGYNPVKVEPEEEGGESLERPVGAGSGHEDGGGAAVAVRAAAATAADKPRVAVVGAKAMSGHSDAPQGFFSKKVLHEVFLNPGLYLLFGGILIGFLGRLQGTKVTEGDDHVFVFLFHGMLCLFLLEMGMTACKRLKDLKAAGWPFIGFGLIAPNIFAVFGMCICHAYSMFLGVPFEIGTYALFAVLCAAASYIAVPAVQRLAIPEASPTLPLAASLGLTFSYNVTIGIPLYILFATFLTTTLPVAAQTAMVLVK